jgi:hypothetical protein
MLATQLTGKVHPRPGQEDSEWVSTYISTLSLTSALDGRGWSTSRPAALPPGMRPATIAQEARWAPGPVWTGTENLNPPGDSIPGPSCL